MEYYPWPEIPQKDGSRWLCLPLAAGVLVLGLLGVSIGVATLAAYAVCQVPTIRSAFGNYFTNTTLDQVEEFYRITYTIEIIIVSVSGILGILANALLVYGVLKNKKWYLMHWLVLHVVAMAAALVAAILVAILQDHLFKLFCLIPFALVFLIIYCWMNVFQLFQEMEPEADLPKPCKEHPYGINTYLATDWAKLGPEEGVAQWSPHHQAPVPQHQEVLEFYPVDRLGRNMQERLERPDWQSSWSVDRDTEVERNAYLGLSDTDSSIVPDREDSDEDDRGNNTYDTLPATGTHRSNHSGHSRSSQQHHHHHCAGHVHVHGEDHVHVLGEGNHHEHTTTPCLVHHGLYHRPSQESKTDSNLSQVEI